MQAHARPARTLLAAGDAAEGAQALAAQEVPEDVGEGVAADLRGLLHPHLPLGLAAARLADLGALGARVRVAAPREGARQALLRRHHLEPVPCGAAAARRAGTGTPTRGHRHGDGDSGTWEDMRTHGHVRGWMEMWMGTSMD